MRILAFLTLALFTFSLMAFDAEARRLGGGKSFGKQRGDMNLNKQQQAAPKQQPQQAAGASTAAAGGAAAAGGSKWLGPLAGLAAGGLLAALFMGGAFDGINMMDILVLIALAAGIFFVVRMLRKPAHGGASRSMQYAGTGAGRTTTGMPFPGQGASAAGSAPDVHESQSSQTDTSIPTDFDADTFLKQAKRSFIALQAAHDAQDLAEIRDFTTPELFAELSAHIAEDASAGQQTEVLFVEASLLDLVTEGNQAIASVRFSGELRESSDAAAEAFDEIWHVQKDLDDRRSAWLLAGIQQAADLKH
ncbi:MAG: Tim44-like domain-containing protein [Nitrosomonas sp.]|nr:Tim44-like domain-containing protein [Nitrosomonas sp.]